MHVTNLRDNTERLLLMKTMQYSRLEFTFSNIYIYLYIYLFDFLIDLNIALLIRNQEKTHLKRFMGKS